MIEVYIGAIAYMVIALIIAVVLISNEWWCRNKSIYHHKALLYSLGWYIGVGWLPFILFLGWCAIGERLKDKKRVSSKC